jgi:hypothetical protein
METPVLCAIEVQKYAVETYHMLITRVMIVPAEDTDGICDIGPSGGLWVHKASDNRLGYGRITGFFVRLALVKLHRHGRGNWSRLIHSELRQDHPNVAVLMDVDHVMLPIEFDVHAEIAGDTTQLMNPEPLHYLVLDLPNQALVSNYKEIIDIQNDCGNHYSVILLAMEHEQSSVDM